MDSERIVYRELPLRTFQWTGGTESHSEAVEYTYVVYTPVMLGRAEWTQSYSS